MAAGRREWFDSVGGGGIATIADRVRTRLCLPQSDWIFMPVLRPDTCVFGDGAWACKRRVAHRAVGRAAFCSDRAGLPVECDCFDLAAQANDTTPVALDFTFGRDPATDQLDLSTGCRAKVKMQGGNGLPVRPRRNRLFRPTAEFCRIPTVGQRISRSRPL